MTTTYYTQTPNFSSSSSSDVDPRTRLFSFNYTLATLSGNNRMGPGLALSMSYNPSSLSDYWSLGKGIELSLTVYDKNNGNLNLSTGEVYKINDTGSAPVILQQKIPSVIFTRIDAYNYRVVDKNGNVTLLKDLLQNGVLHTVQILSPLGYGLNLNWKNSNSGYVLSTVTDDDNRTLCSLSYDSAVTTFTAFPDTTERYDISISKTNGYMTSFYHSELGANSLWQLFYKDVGMGNGLQTLYKMQTPTGLTKEVIYNYGMNTGVIRFPESAGLPPLPAVTRLTVSPGQGQPDMVTDYYATAGNNDSASAFPDYLGYDYKLGSGWSPQSDYLYGEYDPDYTYQTIIHQAACDGQNEIISTYTYNNYHLLISVVTVQGDSTHTLTSRYYLDDYPYKSFDALPAQYQFPKCQIETWTNSDGQFWQENTGYEYDLNGNQTSQITLCDDDGNSTEQSTVVTKVYYPAEGEADSTDKLTGCPKDPWGFTHWLKYQKTVPPVLDGYNDVPTRTTFHRYQSLNTLDSSPAKTAILPAQETLQSSDSTSSTILMDEIFSFDDNTTSSTFGRINRRTNTIYDTEEQGYTQTVVPEWDIDATTVTCTNTLTTHDGFTKSSTLSKSSYTGRVISVIDNLKNSDNFYYDTLGRLTSTSHNSGTDYETNSTLTYTLSVSSDSSVTEISTEIKNEATGVIKKIFFDGMGRPISAQQNGADFNQPDTMFETCSIVYDAWGRLSSKSMSDVSYDGKTYTYYSSSVTAEYDNWGQEKSVVSSEGSTHINYIDPVNRYELSQVKSTDGTLILGSTKTEFTPQGTPFKQTVRDKEDNDYSTTSYEYDGLGRLRKVTDPMNHVTSMTYDLFNRVSEKTLPNNSVISWTYVPFSPENVPQTISMNGNVVGSRDIDGLGRCKGMTCGGRYESAQFTGSEMAPYSTTDAEKNILNYTWVSELNNSPDTIIGTDINQSFIYDKPTGRLYSAKEQDSRDITFSWYASGLADDQVFSDSQSADVDIKQSWSLMGLSMGYQDISGNSITLGYDQFGRYQTTSDPLVSSTVYYDPVGRLYKQECTSDSDELITELILDDYSREQQRTISASSGNKLTVVQTFYPNNQLFTRTTTLGDETLRDETFIYDECNRLSNYTCSGSNLPVDAYNHAITALDFTLDDYNNITQCITTLSDGSQDIAKFYFKNTQDPCQLTSVTHTLSTLYPESITLTYDDNGRMKTDEAGRSLTYDSAGRLITISGSDGNSTYGYDALDTLVTQSINDSDTRSLYYLGSKLLTEVHTEQEQQSRYIPGAFGTMAVSDEPTS
ncbi:RHS repeat protein [Salmonella enterica subsp. enterica]